MAIYTNSRAGAAITSAEFTSTNGQHFAFLQLSNAAEKEAVKQSLLSASHDLSIGAETQQDNHPVLVVKGKSQEEMLSLLSAKGESFALYTPKKPFQPWALRGKFSIVGQTLDLASVYIANRTKSRTMGDNIAYLTFSTASICASLINIVFGAKVMQDEHRTRFLKTQVNDALTPYLPEGTALPSVDDNVSLKVYGPPKAKTLKEKLHDFGRRNSVYIDMGLRYFGNFNLIVPITNWMKPGWEKLNKNPYSVAAGVTLLIGKTITAFSKVPDPYNKAPRSGLDKAREKVFFKTGNVLESFSALFMGYNSFKGAKIDGVHKTNPLAGIANILFMGGYGVRWFAPFGVREVDMKEIEAHIAAGLVQVPADKLPQLVADITSKLKEDLKDKPVEFGQIYTQIHTAVERYKNAVPSTITAQPAKEMAASQPSDKRFAQDDLKRKAAATMTPLLSRAEPSMTSSSMALS